MTLNDVYVFTQIVAAILVVPTLLFLALQVRQNTKQLKAAARFQFVEATGQMNSGIATAKQAASVYRRGVENYENLDADERCQFFFFIGQQLQIHSVMFELHEDGLLPPTQWHNVRKDILTIVRSPGGRRIWEDFARAGLHPQYVAFVDRLVASAEDTYDTTKI